MKTMTVGEFKAQFSEVITEVKNGGEIAVTFGKKKEIIGYFKPNIPSGKPSRNIGLYHNTPGYYMADDFCKTTDLEFPNDGNMPPYRSAGLRLLW
jgi:hypothetical protein